MSNLNSSEEIQSQIKMDPFPENIQKLILDNVDVLKFVFERTWELIDLYEYHKLEIQFREKIDALESMINEGLLLDPESNEGKTCLTLVGLTYIADKETIEIGKRIFDTLRKCYIGSDGEHKLDLKELADSVYYVPWPRRYQEVYNILFCFHAAPISVFSYHRNQSIKDGKGEEGATNIHATREILRYNTFDEYIYACKEELAKKHTHVTRLKLSGVSTEQIISGSLEFECPMEVKESLEKLCSDYDDLSKVGFVMMEFGNSQDDNKVLQIIKSVLEQNGLHGIRADEKDYHEDLSWNVMTYVYGCGFGIAVYEMSEAKRFNPNISLEVGAMKALRKPVCLFKDNKLPALHTDILGKLYKGFDLGNIESDIKNKLTKWLKDWNII